MSPVSSSTLTCASARCRNARGSMSNSGSGGFGGAHAGAPPRGAVGCGGVVVVLAGHRLDVDEAGPRLHHARQQREVLAQRVALELRREVEVAQRGVAVEHDAVHLPALALVPVGARVHRHPRLRRACDSLVDVGLERDAPVAARWTARGRTPGSGPRSRRRRTWSRSAAPATTCRRRRRRHPPWAPASSRCPTTKER